MTDDRPIYLDNNASTPTDPRVVEAMLPFFSTRSGNPSAVDHFYGAEASSAVETARKQLSGLVGCEPSEVIFTSGASEADNLAILGYMTRSEAESKHIVVSCIEHKAVLQPANYLKSLGCEVSILPVDRNGLVSSEDLASVIRRDTALVSIMTANNEVGTIQPIEALAKIAHESGAVFHSDAAQAVGHIKVDMGKSDVDMLSISAHKMHGPKGVGALVVKHRRPRLKLRPLTLGGGHEKGMRSGTLNVPGIVGLGLAAEIAQEVFETEGRRLLSLRDFLLDYLDKNVGGVHLNGHPESRLPHNLNVSIEGVQNKALQFALKREVAFSTGSACETGKVEPSHVLREMGFSNDRISTSIRIGLGRFNTREEVQFAARRLAEESLRLRGITV